MNDLNLRRYQWSFGIVLVGAIAFYSLVVGCTSGGEQNPRGDSTGRAVPSVLSSSETGPPPESPAIEEPSKSGTPDDGGRSSSNFEYEKQLPLEGTVRFELSGGCSGCSRGSLSAKAKVSGSDITIEGGVVGCEGPCEAYWPAEGSVTLRGLRRKTYTVRSSLEVTSVAAVSGSSTKRTKLALAVLREDCGRGVTSLTGDEQASPELVDAVGGCLSKIPSETKFEMISDMLNWENSKAFVPVLIQALDDTKVAYLAARMLGRTEDRRAVGPLIKALETDDESLRWDAARSLKIITGEDFGEDHDRWQRWNSR